MQELQSMSVESVCFFTYEVFDIQVGLILVVRNNGEENNVHITCRYLLAINNPSMPCSSAIKRFFSFHSNLILS